MATEIILPKLGMNMESAKIVTWQKREGDLVAVGDVLAEIETEKAMIELEAEAAGVLRRCLVAEGDQVALNQVIALVGSADEDIADMEERLRTQPQDDFSHVGRVYSAWKGQSDQTPSNGAGAGIGRPLAGQQKPAEANGHLSNGQGQGLDADAIRARLTKRGVLAKPAATGTDTPRARKRVAIYGSGLGAKQVLEITRLLSDIEVIGLIDDDPALRGAVLGEVPVLGGFRELAELVSQGALDGVALSFHSEVRKRIHQRIRSELGIRLIPIVDPRAMIGMGVTIEDGALIEAGAVIGPGTVVGEGTIVDIGAVVAHDCYLGPFSHLSPGCVLSGVVCLKENVLVGVGAAINSTVTIGRNVIITPAAAVMNDVPDDVVVSSMAAKIIGDSRRGA